MTVRRVVTTRAGGASRWPYGSFNLGGHVGDDPAAVEANRRRLAAELGTDTDRVVWMDQVHGTTVAVVDRPPDRPLPAEHGQCGRGHRIVGVVDLATTTDHRQPLVDRKEVA